MNTRNLLHRGIVFAAVGWIIAVCGEAVAAPRSNDYVVIVLDDSGSMNENMQRSRGRKIDAAKQALGRVVRQIDNGTQVGVLLLNGARSTNHWLVPLGPLNKPDAITRINRLSANGGTPLGDALRVAADELLNQRSKAIYGTYRLIVVTDGEATDPKLLDQYLPDILARGLVVDAIGVDMRTDHSLATRVHSYRRADDEASLSTAIVEILAESRGDDSDSTQADFALLDALEGVDAAEIVKALATSNNEAVTGVVPASTGGREGFPDGVPPPAPGMPVNAPPSGQPSFLLSLLSTFCTCMLPLLIGLMIFVSIMARKNRNK